MYDKYPDIEHLIRVNSSSYLNGIIYLFAMSMVNYMPAVNSNNQH